MGLLNPLSNLMKYIFSLLTPSATIATILMGGIISAQAQEVVSTSMFNSVVVQRSVNSFNQQLKSDPPPVDGRPPRDDTPGGSRVVQPPVLPEEVL
jgi:hypothetical protein